MAAERHGVPRLSTGDMLREVRKVGSEVGLAAQRTMDSGDLVSDDVILGIVAHALDTTVAARGFLFDGFPRTVAQADGLAALLEERGDRLDAVVSLDVPDAELIARISGRRVCEEEGHVTHVRSVGESTECPRCGGRLIQRTDDEPDTVRRRLDVYREQTTPVLEYYARSDTGLTVIDGMGDLDAVAARLEEVLASARSEIVT